MNYLNELLRLYTLIALIKILLAKQHRLDDICGEMNGRRIYLELQEEGSLFAKHVNENTRSSKIFNSKEVSPNRECGVEIITCPSCIISLKFVYLKLAKSCGNTSVLEGCSCDYIFIYEPPYEDVSGKQFCGLAENNTYSVYKSQTNSIAIVFMNSNSHEHAFTLEYYSERNRIFYQSYVSKKNDDEFQSISSPFFPHLYPRDLSVDYIINCTIFKACRIRLIFTDFQIATTSFIEFFDWNGQRMFVTTGSLFRPPVVLSTGPILVVRFYANGGTNVGYRAKYTFLPYTSDKDIINIDTDCGGYVDNLGGGITMMNMVNEGIKIFDCFWVIKPPENYVHLKTHLYLKIVKYADFAGNTELMVKQGTTSKEPSLEVIHFPHPTNLYHVLREKEHIVPISQGFYVSLRGVFNSNSSLAIMYTAFNYKECYSGSDFLCHNHRCIAAYLICDGFDHCGDNSDEIVNCKQDASNGKWTHRSNFYFPKLDKDSDLKTATLVFIVCSIGLIALIFALISLLYRVNTRARTQMQIQTHLQTINDLIEEGNHGRIEEEIIIDDEPPNYEAPPEYEDVIKSIRKLENQRKSRKKRGCSRCGNHSNKQINSTDELGESSFTSEASSISNINVEGFSRSCQTTPMPECLPESPPPPYGFIRTISKDDIPIANETSALSSVASCSNQQNSRHNIGHLLHSIFLNPEESTRRIMRKRMFINSHMFQQLNSSFSDSEIHIQPRKKKSQFITLRRTISN